MKNPNKIFIALEIIPKIFQKLDVGLYKWDNIQKSENFPKRYMIIDRILKTFYN